MKRIICPFCGEVEVYMLHERVHRGLLFDASDDPCGSTDDVTEYASKVKRCLVCNRKVKIVEQEDMEGAEEE